MLALRDLVVHGRSIIASVESVVAADRR
jgi:hypothetical protein